MTAEWFVTKCCPGEKAALEWCPRPHPTAACHDSKRCVWSWFSGVPIWWRLTAINRPELPHDNIATLGGQISSQLPTLPVTLRVYLVARSKEEIEPFGPAGAAGQRVGRELQRVVTQGNPNIGIELSVETESGCSHYQDGSSAAGSQQLPCLGLFGALQGLQAESLAAVDERLLHTLQDSGAGLVRPGEYHLFVLPPLEVNHSREQERDGGSGVQAQPVAMVGRHRHAWTFYQHPRQGAAIFFEQLSDVVRSVIEAFNDPGD